MPLRDPFLGQGWWPFSEIISCPKHMGKWDRERKAGYAVEDASALEPVRLSVDTKASLPEASEATPLWARASYSNSPAGI